MPPFSKNYQSKKTTNTHLARNTSNNKSFKPSINLLKTIHSENQVQFSNLEQIGEGSSKKAYKAKMELFRKTIKCPIFSECISLTQKEYKELEQFKIKYDDNIILLIIEETNHMMDQELIKEANLQNELAKKGLSTYITHPFYYSSKIPLFKNRSFAMVSFNCGTNLDIHLKEHPITLFSPEYIDNLKNLLEEIWEAGYLYTDVSPKNFCINEENKLIVIDVDPSYTIKITRADSDYKRDTIPLLVLINILYSIIRNDIRDIINDDVLLKLFEQKDLKLFFDKTIEDILKYLKNQPLIWERFVHYLFDIIIDGTIYIPYDITLKNYITLVLNNKQMITDEAMTKIYKTFYSDSDSQPVSGGKRKKQSKSKSKTNKSKKKKNKKNNKSKRL